MLYFSRWKALSIIVIAVVVCLFAVPNFFPESKVKTWPLWAQRHIVLGLDLQGGSHILFEVDANDVRRQKLQALLDDVRKTMREARIGLTGGNIFQGEVTPDQMWEGRLSARTPVPGLYMCGAATHPAGSVIALNGRNAAAAALADAGVALAAA